MLHNASCFPALYSTLLSIYRQNTSAARCVDPSQPEDHNETECHWCPWSEEPLGSDTTDSSPCHAMHYLILSDPLLERTDVQCGRSRKTNLRKKIEPTAYRHRTHLIKPKWNGQHGHVSVMVVARHQIGSCIVASCGLAMMRQRGATIVQMKNEIEAACLAVLKYPSGSKAFLSTSKQHV